MSITLDRHSLGQNAKYPSLYSLSSSFRFSQLASAGYYVAILNYMVSQSVSQSVSQKIDDLSVLATCRSDTLATLSSDVKGSVVHKSTRE